MFGCGCFLKVFFTWKYIKIIFKTLFLMSEYQKTCKNRFTKITFQTQFFSASYYIKRYLVYYQIPNCVFTSQI